MPIADFPWAANCYTRDRAGPAGGISRHLLSPLTLIILPNGDGVLNAFPRQSALNPVGVIELAGQ